MSKPDLHKLIETEREKILLDLERQAHSLLHIINFLEHSHKFREHDVYHENQRILDDYNQEYSEVQNKINHYRGLAQ